MSAVPGTFTHTNPDGCTLIVRIHPGARKNAITRVTT